jgi:hypothetical protein
MCKWFTSNRAELPDTPWRTYDAYRVFARIAARM